MADKPSDSPQGTDRPFPDRFLAPLTGLEGRAHLTDRAHSTLRRIRMTKPRKRATKVANPSGTTGRRGAQHGPRKPRGQRAPQNSSTSGAATATVTQTRAENSDTPMVCEDESDLIKSLHGTGFFTYAGEHYLPTEVKDRFLEDFAKICNSE